MEYFLYVREKSQDYVPKNDVVLSSLIFAGGGQRLSRFLFSIVSNPFKARLAHVEDDFGRVHSSFVVPHNFKFPFLGKKDFEIGPCYTRNDCRGIGIYPDVLKYICSSIGDEGSRFFMLVSPENKSSIRGIEKAGFKLTGKVRRSDRLRRWKLTE